MLDSKNKSHPAKNTRETDTHAPSGVGALLRDERRNRSMDIQQIARMTRLREPFLRAIEREAWDELPPPVFVQGFIRSYARALALDEGRVLALYESARPSSVEPKPLMEPERTGRGRRILLILLVGILGGALLYLWQGNQAPERPPATVDRVKETIPPQPSPEDRPATVEKPALKEAPKGEAPPAGETKTEPAETGTGPGIGTRTETPGAPLPAGIDPYPDPPAGSASPDPAHVLVADVQERTWVQIAVDGRPPRAFNFQPGSHLRWEAEKGMELLIGNAGGIVLTFDGTVLNDLGRPGQVIRIKLPEHTTSNDRGMQ